MCAPQWPHSPARGRLSAPYAVHELGRAPEILGDGNGSPVLSAAFERGEPDLGRVEVDIAGADREGFVHATTGERERARERLHGGFGVGTDCGEESLALLAGQILSAASVDERLGVAGGVHARIASRIRASSFSSTTIPIRSASSSWGSNAASKSGSASSACSI